MWKEIRDREFGKLRPSSFSNSIKSSRTSSLELSNHKEIVYCHRGSVNSLQVDLTEGRYLLAGAADASVAIYDVQHTLDYEAGDLIAKHKSLLLVDKQHEHGHRYAISSAIWYPIDTGLFITGSYDHYIKVWDTNTSQAVMNFKMPGKVYRTAMSSLASSQMLIAVGTEDVQVRLCDIISGAFSHTLSGHRDGVMSIEWSTSSEWVLATGGCDGAIRFWDIRRAGCFCVLDQSDTQLGRRPPYQVRTFENKEDILSRLPVTDLLRCRCVCKLWKSLIDCPRFINHFLNHSRKSNSNLEIFFTYFDDFVSEDFDVLTNTRRLRYPFPWPFNPFRVPSCDTEILGSCNGLLVLSTLEDNIILWNPSIRRFRNIPVFTGMKLAGEYCSRYIVYGFGYDSVLDDYKLVRIVQYYVRGTVTLNSEVILGSR